MDMCKGSIPLKVEGKDEDLKKVTHKEGEKTTRHASI
jgi:hypothetical protein